MSQSPEPTVDDQVVCRILKASIPALTTTLTGVDPTQAGVDHVDSDTAASTPEAGNDDADGADDALVSFLAAEVRADLPRCRQSPALLQGVLAPHLFDLGLCTNDVQCSLMCEAVHDGLCHPEQFPEEERGDAEEGDEDGEDGDGELAQGQCAMCLRAPMPLTFHHLVPKKVHKKMAKRLGLSKEELSAGTLICRQCHSAVHRLFDHETLAVRCRTLEDLLEHDQVRKWVAFAAKQKVVGSRHGLRYKR